MVLDVVGFVFRKLIFKTSDQSIGRRAGLARINSVERMDKSEKKQSYLLKAREAEEEAAKQRTLRREPAG